jgi:hypothetical protein
MNSYGRLLTEGCQWMVIEWQDEKTKSSLRAFLSSFLLRWFALLADGADATTPAPVAASLAQSFPPRDGARDFDFQRGEWRVRHRVKRQDTWIEFGGTCRNRALIDGSANVEEHTFIRATGTTYGIALRAYDAKAGQWAIWWVDSRDPHGPLDPPVKGHFENGVGTFYSDSMVDTNWTMEFERTQFRSREGD